MASHDRPHTPIIGGLAVAATLLVMSCSGNPLPGQKSGSGSSTTGEASQASSQSASSKTQQEVDIRTKEEAFLADCMKKSGFTYVPYVPWNVKHPPQRLDTYEALKAYRSKYGFGQFSMIIYKGDPNVFNPFEQNPNKAIENQLDSGQRTAYQIALYGHAVTDTRTPRGGCVVQALKTFEPDLAQKPQGVPEKRAEASQEENQLKPLAGPYVDCLKNQGIPIDPEQSHEPSGLVLFGVVGPRFDQVNRTHALFEPPDIDPEVARQELKNEIHYALLDLDCGKDYLVAQGKIYTKAEESRPVTGGL